MIIFINKKAWEKKAKKLVKYLDYLVIDGTDESTSTMTIDYNHCQAFDGFSAPKKVWRPVSDVLGDDFDTGFDINGLEESEEHSKKSQKRYLKSKNFMTSIGAVFSAIEKSNGKINVFIVIKNGQYKYFAKKMVKHIKKIVSNEVSNKIAVYDDLKNYDDLSIVLGRGFNSEETKILSEIAKNIGREYISDKKSKNDDADDE